MLLHWILLLLVQWIKLHWVYSCATPLENENDAPRRRDAQFGNHGIRSISENLTVKTAMQLTDIKLFSLWTSLLQSMAISGVCDGLCPWSSVFYVFAMQCWLQNFMGDLVFTTRQPLVRFGSLLNCLVCICVMLSDDNLIISRFVVPIFYIRQAARHSSSALPSLTSGSRKKVPAGPLSHRTWLVSPQNVHICTSAADFPYSVRWILQFSVLVPQRQDRRLLTQSHR